MRKMIHWMFALSAVAGVALMLGATAPAEAAAAAPSRSGQTSAITDNGNEPQPLDSCNVYKAREMCCPIWCAGKGKNAFEAAKALSGCARGYSCDWNDLPSYASFQCDSACK